MNIPNLSPTFEYSGLISAVDGGAPITQIWTLNTFYAYALLRLEIQLTSAVATSLLLGETGTVANEGDPNDLFAPNATNGSPSGAELLGANGTAIALTWNTPPVIADNYQFRRILLPATVGASVVWEWPEENPLIVCPQTVGGANRNTIVLMNGDATNATADMILNLRYREFPGNFTS